MALGEWLRQMMVDASALKHRATGVARLVGSRELVAQRFDSKSHRVLFIERGALQRDFLFLAGAKPKVVELFRGNAVELLLERNRLKLEAARAEVVVAPWRMFDEDLGPLKWHPFLDARLELGTSLEEQLPRVVAPALRRRLQAAGRDRSLAFRISRSWADFEHFYAELYLPSVQHRFLGSPPEDPKATLAEEFRDGGVLALVSRGKQTLGAALLLERKGGVLVVQRTGLRKGTGPAAEAALEVAIFSHANELRCGWLDFGAVPSRLADPQFVHLQELGCRLQPARLSPPLMLEVRPALRPKLFALAPLLTGDPGAFTVQTGCPAGERKSGPALRREAQHFEVPGVERIALWTDARPKARARVLHERVLREVAGEVPVEVREAD